MPRFFAHSTVPFLSTPSARRATANLGEQAILKKISIHALCEEGDRFQFFQRIRFGVFLSTPSARRATIRHDHTYQQGLISIHALCEEGDLSIWGAAQCEEISIHALCEEGDSFASSKMPLRSSFLSTPSARRATSPAFCGLGSALVFLSTPSARRATKAAQALQAERKISIHALCEEGDQTDTTLATTLANFYPRPLRGGRRKSGRTGNSQKNFYPRPLRGGRPVPEFLVEVVLVFLSTPSARRATAFMW